MAVVEQHIPAGPRAARSTQKKVEASIATWERVREAQFHQQQKARFAKPPPPEKRKGLTKAQRRARRRRELRGPVAERAWPTRKQLSAAARARIVGDGDDDEEDASAGEVSEASSSSSSSSGEEEEESDDDEEEEEAGGGRGGRGRGGRGGGSRRRRRDRPRARQGLRRAVRPITDGPGGGRVIRETPGRRVRFYIHRARHRKRPAGRLGAIGRRGASTGRALRRGDVIATRFVAGVVDV